MKKRESLIFKIFLLMTMAIVSSCSNDDTALIEINGRFIQEDPNCEGFDCTDYIQFIGNSQADLAKGDIVSRVTYRLIDEKIELYFDEDKKMNFSFIIKDERTLIRTEDNTNWLKL